MDSSDVPEAHRLGEYEEWFASSSGQDITWFVDLDTADEQRGVELHGGLVGHLKLSEGRWFGVAQVVGDPGNMAVAVASGALLNAARNGQWRAAQAWARHAGRNSIKEPLGPKSPAYRIGDRTGAGRIVTRFVDDGPIELRGIWTYHEKD